MDALFIYCTTSGVEEARKIARNLVESKLAACANILPNMESIYSWQGEVCEESECVLVLKATKKHFPELEAKILALHSYDCPCIIALPIEKGHAPYLQWVQDQSN